MGWGKIHYILWVGQDSGYNGVPTSRNLHSQNKTSTSHSVIKFFNIFAAFISYILYIFCGPEQEREPRMENNQENDNDILNSYVVYDPPELYDAALDETNTTIIPLTPLVPVEQLHDPRLMGFDDELESISSGITQSDASLSDDTDFGELIEVELSSDSIIQELENMKDLIIDVCILFA